MICIFAVGALAASGETPQKSVPKEDERVVWGIPVLSIDCAWLNGASQIAANVSNGDPIMCQRGFYHANALW